MTIVLNILRRHEGCLGLCGPSPKQRLTHLELSSAQWRESWVQHEIYFTIILSWSLLTPRMSLYWLDVGSGNCEWRRRVRDLQCERSA